MNPHDTPFRIAVLGAGTIGTAMGNILAETSGEKILLHSIEPDTINDINELHVNTRYFPAIRLHDNLTATPDPAMLRHAGILFLAVPSVAVVSHLESLRGNFPEEAILVNLAKGFGSGHHTIIDCLEERFPNPVFTLKGPGFAREIINRLPTGLTLGHRPQHDITPLSQLFRPTNIHLDYSEDMTGVELLSILKNIYAVAMGIVDAQFNSPNLRFLILSKALREMRRVLVWFGGKEETLYNYCGYGDFSLTALNDLSRNRTLGLLIGKGFFTENVSHSLVLEGITATRIFYSEMSCSIDVHHQFPLIAELHRIFSGPYDISSFVPTILKIEES